LGRVIASRAFPCSFVIEFLQTAVRIGRSDGFSQALAKDG
jgi:hypothetical protein